MVKLSGQAVVQLCQQVLPRPHQHQQGNLIPTQNKIYSSDIVL
jgi:hypothetical protein